MLRARFLVLALGCVVLVACGRTTLYSDLSEQQANEIVAALQAVGLDARKELSRRKNAGWEVQVPQGHFPEAMDVLAARGLPRERFSNLGDLFAKEGFASSALEEKARYIHGMTQVLEDTLSRIDGVVTARVHIALPERDPLGGNTLQPSASVVLFEESGGSLRERETSIKGIVKDGVEGLRDINNVTVAIFPARQLPESTQARVGAVPSASMAGFSSSPLALAIGIGVTAILTMLGTSLWLRPHRGGRGRSEG
ncbi:type III secretion system inner membrane ring lipoprotein SctJ [Coralloluteibacterium thermophilus]|uniref:Lipoprotein n=1 Tax=Coralloluteibacterium thermophilum TaxID=2707049 RepID=A0ABV9NNK7_9GAMM